MTDRKTPHTTEFTVLLTEACMKSKKPNLSVTKSSALFASQTIFRADIGTPTQAIVRLAFRFVQLITCYITFFIFIIAALAGIKTIRTKQLRWYIPLKKYVS